MSRAFDNPWRAAFLVAQAIAVLTAGGCKSPIAAVKPWERETLSRPDMAWETDRMLSSMRSHVFFSKEAARGGAGGGGGGCGCN